MYFYHGWKRNGTKELNLIQRALILGRPCKVVAKDQKWGHKKVWFYMLLTSSTKVVIVITEHVAEDLIARRPCIAQLWLKLSSPLVHCIWSISSKNNAIICFVMCKAWWNSHFPKRFSGQFAKAVYCVLASNLLLLDMQLQQNQKIETELGKPSHMFNNERTTVIDISK